MLIAPAELAKIMPPPSLLAALPDKVLLRTVNPPAPTDPAKYTPPPDLARLPETVLRSISKLLEPMPSPPPCAAAVLPATVESVMVTLAPPLASIPPPLPEDWLPVTVHRVNESVPPPELLIPP